MLRRKNTGLLLIVFILILFVYCIVGLVRETRSRALIIEDKDILMFAAEEEMKLDDGLTEKDNQRCFESLDLLIKKFDPYTSGLEKVVIHHRLDLRRGLASKDKIWIRCIKDIQEFEKIFIHELGHIVHQNYISDELEESFFKIGGVSISGYGGERPEEDFAESFLMYIEYGDEFRHVMLNNKILESKYDFIKLKIFDGFEFKSENGLDDRIVKKHESKTTYPYDVSVLHKR